MAISPADAFLVEQIEQGDQDAWLKVIDKFQGRLVSFARARVGNDTAAEDIVQETFIGLLRSMGRFDKSRSLETYLFGITRNKIVDHWKAQGRKPPATGLDALGDQEASMVDGPSSAVLADEKAAREERVLADVLGSFIATLREQRRFTELKVIELLFCLGMRNKEAAAMLGLDEKSVAGIKFRALKSLQSLVREADVRKTAFPELWR